MRREDPGRQTPSRAAPLQVPSWLEERWIRRLRSHYDTFNSEYCGSRLRPPILRIGEGVRTLGEWNPRLRTLSIARVHILEAPWERVLDTLRHEMAHQYVSEVLDMPGAPPHGEPFARACRLLRCDPQPSGASLHSGSFRAEREKVLSRVKDLFALARSPNEHEAASAMRMAHRLLLKHNLDMSQAEEASHFESRYLGVTSGRVPEYQYALSTILQDHFFVLVIWTASYDARRDVPGRILQICGSPENLEIAGYVYEYVTRVLDGLWEERRRRGARGRGNRNQYLAGVLRGFQTKLDRQKQELRQEHGLIWLGDPELRKYYRYLHPSIRMVSLAGASRNRLFQDGMRDGQKLEIRRAIGGDARQRGRSIAGPPSPLS